MLNPWGNGGNYNQTPLTEPRYNYEYGGFIGDLMNLPSGSNPWDSAVGNYEKGMGNAQNAASNSFYGSDLSQKQSAYEQAVQSAYPTFPNNYGIGAQMGAKTPLQSSAKAPTSGDPGTTSRGFNPWSLQGEALAR